MIPTPTNVKTITDLREKTLELLRQVQRSHGPIYIFNRSKPQAVILNVNQFQELVERLDDFRDTLEFEEAIETSTGEFIDFEAYDKARRKNLGLNVQNNLRKKS